MPNDGKVCTFDCLYCEAGFNAQGPGTTGFPSRQAVSEALAAKLDAMKAAGQQLDVITFSGNGEPTIHPDFPAILRDTIAMRDEHFPEAKVSVLTNSTRIFSAGVAEALALADNNILKLDSAIDSTIRAIDRPTSPAFTADRVVEALGQFAHTGIIQTMMVRGEYQGVAFDNTTDAEIGALIEAYRRIRPREVMLYSLDRPTPASGLHKVPVEELRAIADRIRQATGIPVMVS